MMELMKLLDALDHSLENSEMRWEWNGMEWNNCTTRDDAQDATVESQR